MSAGSGTCFAFVKFAGESFAIGHLIPEARDIVGVNWRIRLSRADQLAKHGAYSRSDLKPVAAAGKGVKEPVLGPAWSDDRAHVGQITLDT